MRFLRGITIAAVAILLGLFMAAYRPWRSGANHGETGSTGGSNVAQSNNPATGAQGVQQPVQGGNQSTEKVQQPAKGVKQQAAATQGAKRQAKSAKRPTVKMRRAVEQEESADCECQGVETQGVEQVVIDVIEPTEYYEEETTISVEPRSQTEDMKYTYYWPTTQTVNITVPQSQECPTPYHEVWVEFPGR